MPSALDQIDPHLRIFVEPQIEQMGLDVKPIRFGVSAVKDRGVATGRFWAASIADSVLVTSFCLRLRGGVALTEYFGDYACLCQVSRATLECALECTPLAAPRLVQERDNLAAFVQPAGSSVCDLAAGELYESRSICLTPRFVHKLKELYPHDFAHLEEDIAHINVNEFAFELDALMRDITVDRALRPGSEAYFTAKVTEACSLLVSSAEQAREAHDRAGCASQVQLVSQACRLIDRNLDKPLSLAELAAELYVSRTRLCAAFSQEKQMSIGAYTRQRRVLRAQELLRTGRRPIAEVARAVGYERQSSFASAFKKETGYSPTEWRALA